MHRCPTYGAVLLGYEMGVGVISGLLSVDELLYIFDEIPVELAYGFDPPAR